MADFLQDYSNLAAAGSAFEGFAKGFSDAQDKKMKRMQSEAELEATKAKLERDQDQEKLNLFKEGYKKNASGDFQEAPLSPRLRSANKLKAFGEGAQETGVDENGTPTGYTVDPTSPKAVAARTASQIGLNRNERAQEGVEIRRDTIDRREHERVLSRINSNPNVKARLTQYQNLDNALGIITQSDSLTPQQIYEFQQAVRSNLGIKGSSGVGEREETYFKTAGLNAANWKQFLTGEPANIAKDSKLLHHFQQLAQIEQQNISGQFDKSLNAAAGGHKSMYDRRPDLKEDLKDAVNAQREQMQAPQQPQGLIQQQGLVGGGLVRGGAAQAPAAAPHPQDQMAVQWAQQQLKQNPQDPKALAILKANGM